MKTGARFLAMLLAVVMIASAALSVSAFDDIAGNKHADAINVLSQLGILGGYEDGTFKPDQKVTRAEMAKLVYVLYTTFVDAGTAKTEFKDVKADHWATGYINWCSGKEIIGGFGDGTFAPNANVTYDQALKMVAGALGYKNWDSKLWPTDVRMKALNELKLGKELDGVNGSAELTRAQVAQIIYNALEVPMAEKKVVTTQIGGYPIPLEVPKVLATDIWNFTKDTAVITGTDNYALEGGKAVDEDEIQLDGVTVALKDLGLEKYEGKTDNLIGLTVTTVKRDGKLLASATISGSVVDGVKVAVSTDKKNITINGVSYKSTSENIPEIWTLGATVADEAIFDGEVVKTAIATIVAAPYIARAIDKDGDGNIDAIVLASKAAYKAGKEVEEDDVKYVEYTDLAGANKQKFVASQMTATIKEGDVFVAAKISDIVYVEVVKPVEATATKLNSGKVTLDVVGEVVHGEAGLVNATIDAGALGVKQNYWIYNGEIILSDAITVETDSYNFAILKEVIKSDRVFNEETKVYEIGYKAVIVVDGAEKEIKLAADEAIINGSDTLTATEAFEAYGIEEGVTQPIYAYAVVANYAEAEEGAGYTLVLNKEYDDVTLVTSGKITYNKKTDLFTVGTVNKVVLDNTTNVYYTYTKTATTNFKYLGRYTESNIPTADKFEATIEAAYVAKNDDATYTLLFALVNSVDTDSDAVVTPGEEYLTDGRLVVYAPYVSSVVLGEDGKKYYEYTFMDLDTLKNKAPVVDKTLESKDATETKSGNLYAWNGQKYVDINADTTGLVSVKKVALTDPLATRNLIDIDGETVKIADSVIIWGLSGDTADVYKEYTLADIEDMLEIKDVDAVEALVFTYVDSADNTVIDSIIINVIAADDEGVAYNVNEAIFTNF
ncbi:MAG: S-layer homology domain-containing protein [Ruminococcaceae bacterium]|nr:S-layer homology domain-containing protein [Oscillospiraceae bacterium]